MQQVYFIIFYLCFGIPLSYSAASPWKDTTCYQRYRLFLKGMEVYHQDVSCKNATAVKAFKTIKSWMLISPKIYALVVAGYLRLHFDRDKIFPLGITPIILNFYIAKEDEAVYQARKKLLLKWALKNRKWGFLTEWLVYEQQYSRFYDIKNGLLCSAKHYLDEHIKLIKKNQRSIIKLYTYKNNFLNKKLLLWLVKCQGFPVWTDEEINRVVFYNDGFYRNVDKERSPIKYKHVLDCLVSHKKDAYKLKAVQLLSRKHKGFFSRLSYRVQCAHLLNKQCLDDAYPCSPSIALPSPIFTQDTCTSRLVLFVSTAYWKDISPKKFIRGSSVVVDLIYTTTLLLFDTIFCCAFRMHNRKSY